MSTKKIVWIKLKIILLIFVKKTVSNVDQK